MGDGVICFPNIVYVRGCDTYNREEYCCNYFMLGKRYGQVGWVE